MKYILLLLLISTFSITPSSAQLMETKEKSTRADTLRGSLNELRTWWNVLRYDIVIQPDISRRIITGKNRISFSSTTTTPLSSMQIDLQQPMQIDSI